MEIPENTASFADIETFIKNLLESSRPKRYTVDLSIPENYLFTILWHPITPNSIYKLKEEWEIKREKHPTLDSSSTDFINKIIRISPELEGYERDKDICHEIVHANYGKMSSDLIGSVRKYYQKARFLSNRELTEICRKNNVITEYFGRIIRSKPDILTEIWRQFEIPPKVYDRTSLIATLILGDKLPPQSIIKEEYYLILMD